MNSQEIFQLLSDKDIPFESAEHKAVGHMAELSHMDLPYPEEIAKNLLIRDDKKQTYYLLTVKRDKRINLKEFRNTHHTRPLSFASENDLMRILGLAPGSVSPFGIFNDKDLKVKMFLDKDFLETPGLIGVHPNHNTVTIWLKAKDLVRIIKEHGNEVEMIAV